MVLKRSDGDLCSAYRPFTFTDVVGQREIVESLRKAVLNGNVSQCYLFQGESGCGKTTLAKVVSMALNCTNLRENADPCCECDNCKAIMNKGMPDCKEINASDANGINEVRAIIDDLKHAPMYGKVKIYILDEAHGMSGKAQDALLQDTDSMPKDAYFIMCSTEPTKIKKTLRDRFESYRFKTLPSKEIGDLVEIVSIMEGHDLSTRVKDAIIEVSEGRPRRALKSLQKAINLGVDEDAVLEAINYTDEQDKEMIDLCRAITNKNHGWSDVVRTFKRVNAPPMTISLVLAGWFKAILMRAQQDHEAFKAYQALSLFVDILPEVKPENKLMLNMYKAHSIYHGRKV